MTVLNPAPTTSVPARTSPRPHRTPRPGRTAAALVTSVLLLLGLSGCLQLNAQMTVGKNDTVSGRILVAGDNASELSVLDRLSPPSGLEEKVRISNYSANGYSGKEIYFTQLSFTEMDALSLALDFDGSRPYTLAFHRTGGKVTFTGSVDLSSVPADRAGKANTHIDLTFPSPVTETNGDRGNGNSVSWSPAPGSVTRMDASSEWSDPAARGYAVWMIVGIGAALLVSIATILAARSSRARADRLTGR